MNAMKHIALGGLLLAFAACSGEPSQGSHAMRRPHVAFDRVVLHEGEDLEKTTLRFLDEQRTLIEMRAPSKELLLERAETDTIGMKHVRFRQVTRGIPVVGAELAAHYDATGRVAAIDANYIPDLDDVDIEPKLDVAASRAIAKASIQASDAERGARSAGYRGAKPRNAAATTDGEELVVFALGERAPRLAYTHTIRISGGKPAIWIVTVDAMTGEILDRIDNLQTIQATSPGVKGDTKTFEVTASGNGFVMTDASSGVEIRTFTAANEEVTPGEPVQSTTLTEWDRVTTGAGAAVDAHVYAGVVLDYYKKKHQRNAIDGAGGPLLSTVHFGTQFNNAFWDGTGMTYGDGDGTLRSFSVALDVVSHEISHGVTERTSKLRYQGQPGALNEAFSDIIGAFVEHARAPDDVKNWQMGEDLDPKGAAIRDMKSPNAFRQPAAMSQYVNTQQDNGGVHINSGIVNNAAFLMTVGGTNPVTKVKVPFGIGWEKSEKVWYRANTKYFLETTNFGQAAQGVLRAAQDLGLTPNEIAIIDCAWKAVGVAQGSCSTIVDPNPPKTGPTGEQTDGGASSPAAEQSEDTSGVANSAEEDDPAAPAAKKKRRVLVTTTTGCNAGPRSYGEPLVLLFALAMLRRFRPRESHGTTSRRSVRRGAGSRVRP